MKTTAAFHPPTVVGTMCVNFATIGTNVTLNIDVGTAALDMHTDVGALQG